MKKKQLLFVTQYLQTGGIEKSLLTLLSDLDYDQYEVDLLLFDYSGVLFKMIPKEVNILPPLFENFSTSLIKATRKLVKKGKYNLLIGKWLAAGLARLSSGMGTGVRWAVYRQILPKQIKHYDVAISYIDFFCNYYVTEKVSADKKIVYNHMDYAYSQTKGWQCPRLERKTFLESNFIVTVAKSSKESLVSYFPEFENKMVIIQNRVSDQTVQEMSNENSDMDKYIKPNYINIVTVARLVEEKGVFLALEACRILMERGHKLQWLLIGNGSLYQELKDKSKEIGVESNFILLGEKENPYPYISRSDIYVQPSKTEAHCVAVEEAIALSRPIVVTEIPSFQNQIIDRVTGLITKTSGEGIANAIEELIRSKELRKHLTDNLISMTERNHEELKKFIKLLTA